MQRTRALVFGLDGGTWDLIDPLIARGDLPVFAELKRDSAWAPTSTTWPAHTAPGWTSFVTASSPGMHGIYNFFHTQDPFYGARIAGTSSIGRSGCWEWASARGLSLGLINIPMSHPALPLAGYQITWPLKQTTRYCQPPYLLSDLSRNGHHFQSDLTTMYRGDLNYIDDAIGFVAARMSAARYMLESWPTDVFAIVLTEVDRVCHHYWHFSDASHPAYPEEAAQSYRDAIRNILRAVDRELAKTLAMLPDDCSVVVVSDHGFGPGHRSLAMHAVLESAGLLRTVTAEKQPGEVASWFSEDGRSVDWDHTSVYMPVPGSYGLNLNLRGRQHRGIIEADDAESVLEETAAVLQAIRIPESGKPAFQRILRREEAYSGPMMQQAPDLLLVPNETLMVTPSCGSTWSASYQTGLHRHQGMWMHRSSRVCAGRLPQRVRLIDVLPTLFADLGFEVSGEFQGEPVSGIFSQFTADEYKAEDEWESPELTARLKAMGYL
ncbi:alkaline phosphatase family protein [Bradyrhizobium diazoefficiens]|uniref:alkaline phosphatase family protein n=1 Tax=Bradyrhizobium diazoefficiens TaxID=1355477 RepID=UPI001B8B1431|nr:alkaline phosphatase family protein [Bradyrhizobium diazoefficiens]MBR0865891.1 alkaline phosphatase family protein [Bradyrhizobium diazoefficiens]MBR0890421.1 alkaline phosphatase family protein [Bradyrhizobium diazoefficiens]MBR0922191.1 alkaline phosphatase family protein [Bradyrhizobium diazoefficiens]